jgi:TPR repeat protein
MQHERKQAGNLLKAEMVARAAYGFLRSACSLVEDRENINTKENYQRKAKEADQQKTLEILQKKALELYKKAESMGSMTAFFGLGFMYFNGIGIPRNSAIAIKYFKQIEEAAKRRDAAGEYALSQCYKHGLVVKIDMQQSEIYLRRAVEQGYAPALYFFAGLSDDHNEKIKYYRQAAELGYAPAQSGLGDFYRLGHGVTQDLNEAIKNYKLAADQGYAYAQASLGDCYRDGRGVTRDTNEAAKYYERAADQGNAHAQRELAILCRRQKNLKEAEKYYKLAADKGDVFAQEGLADLYSGKGVSKDFKKAVFYYRLVAEKKSQDDGWSTGIHGLYKLYSKKQGKPNSLYHLAVYSDHAGAARFINELAKRKILEEFNEFAKDNPEQLIAFLDEYPQDIPRVMELLQPAIIENPGAFQKFITQFAKIHAQIHGATPLPTVLQLLVMEYLMPVNIQTPQSKEIQKTEIHKVETDLKENAQQEAKKAAELKQKSDAENERRKAEIEKKKNAPTPSRSEEYEEELEKRKDKKKTEVEDNPYRSFLWSQPVRDEAKENKLKRELKKRK